MLKGTLSNKAPSVRRHHEKGTVLKGTPVVKAQRLKGTLVLKAQRPKGTIKGKAPTMSISDSVLTTLCVR